jgi:hypothetical protein
VHGITHAHSQIPGFYDHVAPNLIDLAWSSLQQHGGGEFSREGYQVGGGVEEEGGFTEGKDRA